MANRIEKAVARAATVAKKQAGVDIVYRIGNASASFKAAKAGVRFLVEGVISAVDQDWLIEPGDLLIGGRVQTPAPGHRIDYTDEDDVKSTYEVLEVGNGEPCYRVDQTGQLMRVHTKKVR